MKKICLLAVSFLMGHSLTSDTTVARKSIDHDDQYFESLCPSFSSGNNPEIHNRNFSYDTKSLVKKIDREDVTESLLKDNAGSISKFRDFANKFTGVL
jgi:hypothetical protein